MGLLLRRPEPALTGTRNEAGQTARSNGTPTAGSNSGSDERTISGGVTRVVIADDHPIVLKGLVHLVDEAPEMEVVESCTTAAAALHQVRRMDPDILVLDLRIPHRDDGMRVLRELQEEGARTAVIVLTAVVSDEDVVAAMRLGARGIILKDMPPQLLLKCIRKVAAGGTWLENEAVGRSFRRILQREESARRVTAKLTAREAEVLRLVIDGHSNATIAARLFVTPGTVKTHLHTIYDKLGVRGRVPLMLYARESGLV